jgi:lipopolysaccharide transport system permease protein
MSRHDTQARAHHRVEPGSGLSRADFAELIRSRDLFSILVRRELQIRYKQTALGFVWVVLQPLVPALIFATVFGAFARLPSANVPYLLFAMSGMVIWGLFAGVVSRAGNSLLADSRLISKVYFPRALLPASSGVAVLADFGVGLALAVVLVMVNGYSPSIYWLALPVVTAAALCLALGLALAVAALSAFYRDFAYALPFAIQILLFGSPILYSMELVPRELRQVYSLNPLVGVVESFRWALIGESPFPVEAITIGLITGSALILASVTVFSRFESRLADVI